MTRHTENRLRHLEDQQRLPPYREVDYGPRSEAEYAILLTLASAALAGDTRCRTAPRPDAGTAFAGARDAACA